SKFREATLVASSSSDSSNDMNTPGSLNCVAPRTKNSIAKSVLPAPALPQIRVGRPLGTPPLVISSKPGIPVDSFSRAVGFERRRREFVGTKAPPRHTETQRWLGLVQGG